MQRRSHHLKEPPVRSLPLPLNTVHSLHKFHAAGNNVGKTMRGIVFGVHDGVLTILGFVSGAAGLLADHKIIFLTGLAGMVAEGISMGVGEYQSVKVQNEILEREIQRESEEIETIPAEEEKEVYSIYRNKGLTDKEATLVTKCITRNKASWLHTMIVEELGLSPEKENPIRASLIMAIASFLGGAIPLVSYLFLEKHTALLASILFSVIVVFSLGAFKTRYTGKVWWKSGSSMMLIATAVAITTYFIGLGISKLGGILF